MGTKINSSKKGVRRSLQLTENKQEFESPSLPNLSNEKYRLPKNQDLSYHSFDARNKDLYNYEDKGVLKHTIPVKNKPMQARLRQKRFSRQNSITENF